MRWEDERYIRLYTRDTLTWRSWGWQARCVFPLLMRKIDRAGILDVGDDAAAAIALVADLPTSLVSEALPDLLRTETLVLNGKSICAPNFIEAQETPQSDKARKRKSREAARAVKAAKNLDLPMVGHEMGQGGVTPSRAVPSCAVPNQEEQLPARSDEKHIARAPAPEMPSDFVAFVRSEWPDVREPASFEKRARAAFPAVDLLVEARKARGWELSDARRRKHKHGKFLWDWLGRSQDNANRPMASSGYGPAPGAAVLHISPTAKDGFKTPGRKFL